MKEERYILQKDSNSKAVIEPNYENLPLNFIRHCFMHLFLKKTLMIS